MKHCRKFVLLVVAIYLTLAMASCRFDGVGGAGWDDKGDVEIARQYPSTESSRVLVTTEEVPYQTFKQEFDTVFQDFPFIGRPVGGSSEISNTQINGTQYSVSYENLVLKVFRADKVIAERNLPRVFYMHPMSSAAIIGKSTTEDLIVCRTNSRATTGLHYLLVIDGEGSILFERVVPASEDWDILPGNSRDIIIGGAHTKTVISLKYLTEPNL